MTVGIIFLIFVVTLALGIPIAVSIVITAISAGLLVPSLPTDLPFIYRNMVTALDSFALLAVPLFIFSGIVMARGGISKKLFDFFAFFIGKLTAGLPMTAILTCLFYGAISGSGPATVAAVGSMTIPLLVKLGYDRTYVTAMIATAGGLGVIIPPSIPFIIYGLSASQSVGSLFIAGILPGILIGGSLMAYAFYYSKKHGEDKRLLHDNCDRLRAKGLFSIFKDSFWALLAPVIILGGIYGGIITPTEAANVSVIYSLIVSFFIYRSLNIRELPQILRETAKTSVPIMLVVSAATVFGKVLTLMQAPQTIAAAVSSLSTNKIIIMLIINLFLLFVGMVMDTISAILILSPIFLPIVAAVGIDPIHFGVIIVVNLAIGFVTPPVGVNLYVASGMTGISVVKIAKVAIPFMIAFFLSLLIITFIPWFSLVFIG